MQPCMCVVLISPSIKTNSFSKDLNPFFYLWMSQTYVLNKPIDNLCPDQPAIKILSLKCSIQNFSQEKPQNSLVVVETK